MLKHIQDDTKVYDLDYYKLQLNVLEWFDRGSYTLANRIKIDRFYAQNETQEDPTSLDYITKV